MDFGDDFLVGIVAILALIAIIVFMIFIGAPLIVFLIETVWGITALVLGLAARVLFRRPWILTAESSSERRTWQIVGWRAARAGERRVINALRAGAPLPEGFPRPLR